MIKGTLEVEMCSVAVTSVSVVLTVRSAEGQTYTVTMPRGMGQRLAEDISAGLLALPPANVAAVARD